jgi:MYXO-CTERM domain-containing protein
VNLTCAPASSTVHITCSLLPASVTFTSGAPPQTSTLSILTVAKLETPPGAHSHSNDIWLASTGSTLFAALVLCGLPSRRRRGVFLGLLMIVSIGTIVSCGGGSSGGGGGGGGGGTGTPAGTYIVTVTGTGPSTSHSTTVSVTVQ